MQLWRATHPREHLGKHHERLHEDWNQNEQGTAKTVRRSIHRLNRRALKIKEPVGATRKRRWERRKPLCCLNQRRRRRTPVQWGCAEGHKKNNTHQLNWWGYSSMHPCNYNYFELGQCTGWPDATRDQIATREELPVPPSAPVKPTNAHRYISFKQCTSISLLNSIWIGRNRAVC